MNGAPLTPTPPSPAMMSASPMHHVSRPTLGFPLGTALLLIIIFCLSGVFSCCYHWDKLRSLRQRRSSSTTQLPTTAAAAAARQHQPDTSIPLYPSKLTFQQQNSSKQESEQSLPVVMPGDRYPKFMAWPCPCPCPCPCKQEQQQQQQQQQQPPIVIAVEIVLVPSHFSPSPPTTL